MKNQVKLSKKEITETFKKLQKRDQNEDNLSVWLNESEFEKLNNENIWIVSDSTSSFVHFNHN